MAADCCVSGPLCVEATAMADSPRPRLKRHLGRFTGMSPENLQSHLNRFVYLFRVNQAKDKWPETEREVRHLLQVEAHHRS